MPDHQEFEELVKLYYEPLFRFAYSLTRAEADAADLTQQAFYIWADKGRHQLEAPGKVKSWLYTTLHREFLRSRRRWIRFPHFNLDDAEDELPQVLEKAGHSLDAARVLRMLSRLDEVYQAPVALFYLEDYSYREIAEILCVPVGTVKSRLARGIRHLHRLMTNAPETARRQETS